MQMIDLLINPSSDMRFFLYDLDAQSDYDKSFVTKKLVK